MAPAGRTPRPAGARPPPRRTAPAGGHRRGGWSGATSGEDRQPATNGEGRLTSSPASLSTAVISSLRPGSAHRRDEQSALLGQQWRPRGHLVAEAVEDIEQSLGAQHAAARSGVGPQAILQTGDDHHVPVAVQRGVGLSTATVSPAGKSSITGARVRGVDMVEQTSQRRSVVRVTYRRRCRTAPSPRRGCARPARPRPRRARRRPASAAADRCAPGLPEGGADRCWCGGPGRGGQHTLARLTGPARVGGSPWAPAGERIGQQRGAGRFGSPAARRSVRRNWRNVTGSIRPMGRPAAPAPARRRSVVRWPLGRSAARGRRAVDRSGRRSPAH